MQAISGSGIKQVLVVCFGLASLSTQAALVTYEFGATVQTIGSVSGDQQDHLDFLAGFDASVGISVLGSYTVDTSVDRSSLSGGTRYTGAITRFDINIGGLRFLFGEGGDPSASNWITVDNNGDNGDLWQALTFIDIGLPGFGSSIFELTLVDQSGLALDSVDIDQELPGLDAFDPFTPNQLFDTSVNGILLLPTGIADVDMSLDFHRVVVPIPAAGVLMLGALASLGTVRRRSR